MNAKHPPSKYVLAAAVALFAHSAMADDAKTNDAAQLQRNVHEMRIVLDRERAQQDAAARMSTQPLQTQSSDAPGIGVMREQIARNLERLENRCFGIDMNVKDGNAILICGNNTGSAENSTVKSNPSTTIVVNAPVKSTDTSQSTPPPAAQEAP